MSIRAANEPSSLQDRDRAQRPVLAAGALRLALAPHLGGRISGFWIETGDGTRQDIVPPIEQPYADPNAWPKAGCYPLLPFSNRIRNGRFFFEGREVALAAHPSCAPHALHGFAQLKPWRLIEAGGRRARMAYDHRPDEWPFAFRAEQRIALDERGVTVAMTLTNTGSDAMPAGIGLHPYFCAAPGDRVTFAAGTEWEADETGCATRARPLDRPTAGATVGADDGTTRYLSDWSRVARLETAAGLTISVAADPVFDHFVFHTPPGGAYACLEPVSHVADAFNLAARGAAGTGLRILTPGDKLEGEVRIGVLHRA